MEWNWYEAKLFIFWCRCLCWDDEMLLNFAMRMFFIPLCWYVCAYYFFVKISYFLWFVDTGSNSNENKERIIACRRRTLWILKFFFSRWPKVKREELKYLKTSSVRRVKGNFIHTYTTFTYKYNNIVLHIFND